ncbi:MAG: proline dehydrogenase family protein [Bacillota bacterium]|nr:proline dehydrogenase family protein [Bacillota bacterium]
MTRSLLLSLSRNPRAARFAYRHGDRLGVKQFIAGDTLDECVAAVRRLNEKGFHANTTLLGEAVQSPQEAEEVKKAYTDILHRLSEEGLRCNVALKLSHLGLGLGEDVAFGHMEELLQLAEELSRREGAVPPPAGHFIRMDMEESFHVDATLSIYRRLRAKGRDNVGIVLQAYLHRSLQDLEDLLPLRPNFRIVKGAYMEPPSVAYHDKKIIDQKYLELVQRALSAGCYVAVATHDDRLIEKVKAWTEREGISRDRFEFQMLYGIRPALQEEVLSQGYKVLVATPFGKDWYPYLMRRLAERPANVALVWRSWIGGG